MKLKIEPLGLDGKPFTVEVTAYTGLRDRSGLWYFVTDGQGRHWRTREKPNERE